MVNQNDQDNHNPENSTFYDQADGKFSKSIENTKAGGKLSKGVSEEVEEDKKDGSSYGQNLMKDPESQVRENEDASLQDGSYSFDEANTDNEEYHDASGGDIDYDNDEDFVQ